MTTNEKPAPGSEGSHDRNDYCSKVQYPAPAVNLDMLESACEETLRGHTVNAPEGSPTEAQVEVGSPSSGDSPNPAIVDQTSVAVQPGTPPAVPAEGQKKPPTEAFYQRLARLPLPEYERTRKDVAKELGMRVTVLDGQVEQRRAGSRTACADLGLVPWPDAVDGESLLNEIEATLKRFVFLPKLGYTVCAAWVLHTYVFDLFDWT